VVSAVSGGELLATSSDGTQPVPFGHPVRLGDALQTPSHTSADVLMSNQAVVTLLEASEARLEQQDGNSIVHLAKGSVLVSVAASTLRGDEAVIVHTPDTQIVMKGGMLKATVGSDARSTTIQPPSAAHVYLTGGPVGRPVQNGMALQERIEVFEGAVQVGPLGGGAASQFVESGQAVQITGGVMGNPTGLERAANGGAPRLVLASAGHAGTPSKGLDFVAQRQMQQVGALQQALFGAPEAQIEGKESESGAIIATLFGSGPLPPGTSSQSSQQTSSSSSGTGNGSGSGSGSGGTNSGGGGSTGGGSGSGSTGGGQGDSGSGGGGGGTVPPGGNLASLFGSGSPYLAALLAAINRSGAGIGGDLNDGGDDLLDVSVARKEIVVQGGLGSLLVTRLSGADQAARPANGNEALLDKVSSFSGIELLLVDSGALTEAPHGGRAPVGTLVVRGINQGTGLSLGIAGSGNEQFDSTQPNPQQLDKVPTIIVPFEDDPRLKAVTNDRLVLGDNQRVDTLERVNGSIQSSQSETEDIIISDFSSRRDGKSCTNCRIAPRNGFNSYVDARVTARSTSVSSDPTLLLGGVVLDDGTSFTASPQLTRIFQIDPPPDNDPLKLQISATQTYFVKKGTGIEFDTSVAAVVANEDNPAFAAIEDRVLAVLRGSQIQPENESTRTALLSVLDSQFIGPTTTPTSIVDGQRVPNRKNNQVPPLLELSAVDEEGNPVGEQSIVKATSAVVVRSTGIGAGILDGALLEASSPILTLAHSQMFASGHLIDLAGRGPNGQPLLAANIPGDALVRLDRGSVNVNGNLLNLANGASANVNGHIFSIANGSSLNINGMLFSLAGNSILRLNSDAFGIFHGEGNTLRLANNLCAGGEGCGVLTDHLGQQYQHENQPLRVSGVTGNVSLPEGFVPFKSPNATPQNLEILPEAALFHVEAGSELHIKNIPVVPAVRR
jgi:hypothetical protein